jgi:hypothetical protein
MYYFHITILNTYNKDDWVCNVLDINKEEIFFSIKTILMMSS